MKFRRLAWLLTLAICLFLPRTEGDACSVVIGYMRPTNYELVKEADAIVLANAVTFEKKGDMGPGKSFGVFRFNVIEHVKGDFKDGFISVEGDDDIRTWGETNDFSFTKPDHGPCNPTDYVLSGNYVLFLANRKGRWSVGGAPFTRVNVLVEGTNSPWINAVRQYVRIASLSDYEKEKAALHDLRKSAMMNAPGCPAALVEDIDRHFNTPTPVKSFPDLLSLYTRTKDAQTRKYVLWACARGEKQEAKDFFRSLLQSGEWLNHIDPVCSYVAAVKLTGFHETLATTLSTNSIRHERQFLLSALNASVESSQQSFMQKVLESVSKEETKVLADWFVKHPSQEAIAYFTRLAANDYHENTPQTFALAGMGDTNVVNWAKHFASTSAEKRWVSFYVFAISPLSIADDVARQLIQHGDHEDLVLLVQGCQDSTRSDRLDRLRDIARLKSKNEKLNCWLRRTLGDMAYHGNKAAERVLNELPETPEPKQ